MTLLAGEEGFEVIAEGDKAPLVLDHVLDRAPDVLVLDARTVSGSSIDAIRQMRSRAPRTKIVVLTMEESPAFAKRAIDAGAIGLVLQDRADTELPEAVRRAVASKEYVSPRVADGLEALRQTVDGDGLSARETEVLRLIALGHTSAEIAVKLGVSRRTVETHRARIHQKLALDTRAQLVRYALGRHLIGA
jgi:two-component system response regulator NreC